jgi:hypothetical protein
MATFVGIKHFRTFDVAILNENSRDFVLDNRSLTTRIENLRSQGLDVSEELKGLEALEEANK